MPTTVTPRLPTRVEHSTASVAGALATLYGTPASKVPADPVLRQIAQEVEALHGTSSVQAQSDVYLARVRELTTK